MHIVTWHEQLSDLDYRIADFVVTRHYRRSDTRLTPRTVRRMHRDYVDTEASRRRAGLDPLGPPVPDAQVSRTPLDELTAGIGRRIPEDNAW